MMPGVGGMEQSIDFFRQAIAKDRRFAAPYAGIAAAEAARSAFDRFDSSERANMIAAGWAAAGNALRLDPRLADAYDGLGMMQAREAQWKPAERSFRRALELAPREPSWRNHFALFLLLPLGRIQEALVQLQAAEELNPTLPQTHNALGLALRAAGRFDESEFHCREAAENDKARSICWARTLIRQGKVDQAVVIMETQWAGRLMDPGVQSLAIVYVHAGRRADALRIAELAPRPATKAVIFAALGDKERAFEALNQMIPMGPTRMVRDVLISPEFALLHGDPRLKTLRKKVGLPE
jgi:tetratricopeptide (TPR) repeat protein